MNEIVCPVCGCKEYRDYDDLAGCKSCLHIWQKGLKVTANYNAEYVADRYDKYDTTRRMSKIRLGVVWQFCQEGKILDVGYGNGDFLKLAEANGMEVYGADVHGADYGIKEVDLATDDTKWDVVTFFDSLEHFDDLDLARNVIYDANMVVVSHPICPTGFPTEHRDWRHYRPGEHLHYFGCMSLDKFIGPSHFRITSSNVEDQIRTPAEGAFSNIRTSVYLRKASCEK